MLRHEKFASLVAARELQRPSPIRSRGRADTRSQMASELRAYHTGAVSAEGARCQALLAPENGKPTIAQWSVFLPRQGRARRQASPLIVSLPGALWLSHLAI